MILCSRAVVALMMTLGAGALCATTPTATNVDVAFDGDCEAALLKAIKGARQEIKVAIFTFAKKSFADALIDRARSGVKVAVKIDAREAEFEYTVGLLEQMEKARVSVERIQLQPPAKMHHKFAVIDGKTVVTGSFNWTKQASEGNWENLVVIDSPALAQEFLKEWARVAGSE